jgi:hypothetical protein
MVLTVGSVDDTNCYFCNLWLFWYRWSFKTVKDISTFVLGRAVVRRPVLVYDVWYPTREQILVGNFVKCFAYVTDTLLMNFVTYLWWAFSNVEPHLSWLRVLGSTPGEFVWEFRICSKFRFPLLTIIPPLLHTHLSLYDSLKYSAHCHIPGLEVGSFISARHLVGRTVKGVVLGSYQHAPTPSYNLSGSFLWAVEVTIMCQRYCYQIYSSNVYLCWIHCAYVELVFITSLWIMLYCR